MLSCPHCHQSVREDADACPTCSLSLEGLSAFLGPVPLLNRGITDTTNTLSKHSLRSLQRAVAQFEKTAGGPQLNVVLRNFDPQFNLSIHLFWLFNTAGLSSQQPKTEDNRDLLLGLDPATGRLGLMIGYGLEAFITPETIATLLETARPQLKREQYEAGLKTIIRALPNLLTTAARDAHQALGLEP